MKHPIMTGLALVMLCASALCQQVEQRAVWAHFSDIKDPETLQKSVDRIAAAGMNAIYILVWYNGGQATYVSDICPMQSGTPEGFDPLGALIEAAKPKGIDVHAWFVNGSYGHARPGFVFTKHPDWGLQSGSDSGEKWYDLGKDEVRAFQRDVMLECLRKYDVAGIHFDYIRFNGRGMCYCQECQKQVQDQFGIPPVSAVSPTFPLASQMSGNPVGKPSTAQVLATFEDGVPAITLNSLGNGEAALLNWQAENTGNKAIPAVATKLLERFGAIGKTVYQVRNTPTTDRYGLSSQQRGMDWVRGMGCKVSAVTDAELGKVPAGATVLFTAQYLISPDTAAWLERHVSAGGNALFVDGPIFAIKEPALQRVLGLTGAERYFSAMRVISPAPDQDIIIPGPPVDPEMEMRRAGAWEQFRRNVVTDLVRQVYQGAKQIKPEAQVSAAVFYNRAAADSVCQDWYGWLSEGIIDYVLPMAYTEDNAKLREALDEWTAFDPGLDRIIPGLSIYSRAPGGTAVTRDLDLVKQQLELCRSYKARGNCFFALAYLNDALRDQLAGGAYAEPAQAYYPPAR